MAEFLKAKKTSFINKPIGVVNVDTGAIQASQMIANSTAKLTQQIYTEAVDEQKKVGEEYAFQAAVRDDEGNLQFKDMGGNLSDIARQSAEPLLRKRYGIALANDINTEILNIRKNSTSAKDFKTTAESFMGTYITEVSKIGGAEYKQQIVESVGKLTSQHYADLSQNEYNDAKKIAAANEYEITLQSANDLETTATQDLANPDQTIDEIRDKLLGFDAVANNLAYANDSNLKENGLAGDVHLKMSRRAKTITTSALVKALAKDKPLSVLANIRNHLAYNSKLDVTKLNKHDLNLVEILSESSNVDVIDKEINDIDIRINREKVRQDSEITREEKIKIKADKLFEQSAEGFLAKGTFKENQEALGFSLVNEIVADGVTDNVEKKLLGIINNVAKTAKKGSVEVPLRDGTKGKVFLNDSQRNVIIRNTFNEVVKQVIRKSDLFSDSVDKDALRHSITNKTNDGLSPEQIVVKDKILKINELNQFSVEGLKDISDTLTDSISKQNAYNVKAKKDQDLRSNLQDAQRGLMKQNDKNERNLDESLGIDINYFVNDFAADLEKGDAKAIKIDRILRNGSFPASIKELWNGLAVGSLTSQVAIDQAIGMFRRYSNVDVGGVNINKTIRSGLDAKTIAVMNMATDLIPLYKGSTQFFGVVNTEDPTKPVTNAQIIAKINQAYDYKTDPSTKDAYKSKFEALDPANKDAPTNSYDYLKQNFDSAEVQELRGVMDIMVSLGMNKEQIDNKLKSIADSLYADGEGLIIDKFSSGNDITKSKFSLLKMIPNDAYRAAFRSIIANDLAQLKVPVAIDDIQDGKFVLDYMPVGTGHVYSNTNLAKLRKRRPQDKQVYLQPVMQGSDMSNPIYVPMYRKNGEFIPVSPNLKGYSLLEMLERIRPNDSGDYD